MTARALVTGSTGYVGSRLVTALLDAGLEVVATGRSTSRLAGFPWAGSVEQVTLDVLDADSTRAAFTEHGHIDVAYYLVHAIGEGDFTDKDRDSARTFAREAQAAEVGRIVYLGGFVPEGEKLSDHLASRGQVGRELDHGKVDLVWLRAAIILGAGSTSYELISSLADRLPVLPIPSWMNHDVEPIAVDDVLHYLVGAANPALPPGSYDITGPDTLTYRRLIGEYVRSAGLRRLMIPTPLVSTKVAGWAIGRIAKLPPALAQDLIGSLENTMTSRNHHIDEWVPRPPGGATTVVDALRRARPRVLAPTDLPDVAASPDPLMLAPTDPAWAGADQAETHQHRSVAASAGSVWQVLETTGGRRGFFAWPIAWRSRAALDRLAGGPGFLEQRKVAGQLTVGDSLEFLQVEVVEAGRYVRFRTDRWFPGTGSLEIWVDPVEVGSQEAAHSVLNVRARWRPRGLSGRLYWLGLKPFHLLIFPAMLKRIGALAQQGATGGGR